MERDPTTGNSDKTTRRIAWRAAELLRGGREKDWHRARRVAADSLVRGRVPFDRLPAESAIRDALIALCGEPGGSGSGGDGGSTTDPRFPRFLDLLRPLETVLRPRETHPEGDALYHSLQVFDLARDEVPYDEELLLAALLHEVGLAVDPVEPIPASLELLEGEISERTRWLIENHGAIRTMYDGSISARKRRNLRQHPWYDDLVVLAEADRDGRQIGVTVPDEYEALEYIRELAEPEID